MPPSHHRPARRLQLVLGSAAALFAIVAAVLIVNMSGSRPRDLVVEYLDAIAAGDVEAANALAPDGTGASGGELPLRNSLQGATTISDVRVSDQGTPASSGDGAQSLSFTVNYELGGKQYRADVRVLQTGGWWLWEEWRIDGSLAAKARLSVVWPLEEAEVRFANQTLDALQQPQDVPLYPGLYEATPRNGSMIALEPTEVVVTDGLVHLEIRGSAGDLSANADEVVVTAATEALEDCLLRGGTVMGCDGGALLQVDGAQLPSPTWGIDADVMITARSVEGEDFLYSVSATVVATSKDPSGSTIEKRFNVTGEVLLDNVTANDASATARWTTVTEVAS